MLKKINLNILHHLPLHFCSPFLFCPSSTFPSVCPPSTFICSYKVYLCTYIAAHWLILSTCCRGEWSVWLWAGGLRTEGQLHQHVAESFYHWGRNAGGRLHYCWHQNPSSSKHTLSSLLHCIGSCYSTVLLKLVKTYLFPNHAFLISN